MNTLVNYPDCKPDNLLLSITQHWSWTQSHLVASTKKLKIRMRSIKYTSIPHKMVSQETSSAKMLTKTKHLLNKLQLKSALQLLYLVPQPWQATLKQNKNQFAQNQDTCTSMNLAVCINQNCKWIPPPSTQLKWESNSTTGNAEKRLNSARPTSEVSNAKIWFTRADAHSLTLKRNSKRNLVFQLSTRPVPARNSWRTPNHAPSV